MPMKLQDIAIARSGDKGNLFNVGVIARRAEFLPWIAAALTSAAVAAEVPLGADNRYTHGRTRVDR